MQRNAHMNTMLSKITKQIQFAWKPAHRFVLCVLVLCVVRVVESVPPAASSEPRTQQHGSASGQEKSGQEKSGQEKSGQGTNTAPSSSAPTQEKNNTSEKSHSSESPTSQNSSSANAQPSTKAADDASQKPSSTANDFAAIYATFKSMSGEIRVKLHIAESPRTCANFINLARRGYYIRKPWEDFTPVVRQLGSPLPPNAIPYSIPLEHSPKHMFDVGGRLCLANTSDDPGARGHPCRIFITVKPQERWNLNYVIFGTIDRGLEIAQRLTEGELIQEIRVESDREGEVDRFLKAHERNIAKWNAALDKQPLP